MAHAQSLALADSSAEHDDQAFIDAVGEGTRSGVRYRQRLREVATQANRALSSSFKTTCSRAPPR